MEKSLDSHLDDLMSEHGVIGVMCCDKQGLALEGKWVSRILTVLEVVYSWYILGISVV